METVVLQSLLSDASLWIHGALWGVGFLVLAQLRRLPLVPSPASHHLPSVSIIIPARNEEARLPLLLASLNQPLDASLEILVIDDHSEDQTASVATKMGATVRRSQDLPDHWLGKPWACYQGAQAATGDLLIFLDADVTLEEKGLQKIVSTARHTSGAISILPYHTMKTPAEQLSAFFNLIQAASSNAFTLLGARFPGVRPFGPVLVISKSDYFKFGGHEVVKDKVVENFYLADHLRSHKIPLSCFIGQGTINFRMYAEGVRAIARGWNKSFATGAKGTSFKVLLALILWLTGALGTARHLITDIWTGPGDAIAIVSCFYLLYVGQIYAWLRKLGQFNWVTAVFYPVSALFFVGVFAKSVFLSITHRSSQWKGRSVQS